MGSNINWIDERSPFKREKEYLDNSNTNKAWKTIINVFEDIKCDACTRRIKKGQKILIHSETSSKMHLAKDCKLW
jgi:protein-disulfide isomerase